MVELGTASTRRTRPESSNGFIGNNHAVYASGGESQNYKFYWENNPTSGLLQNIVDQSPLTIFEYESINISKPTRLANGSKDFEFLYSKNENRGVYITKDGGGSWKKTLYVNDITGIITELDVQQIADALENLVSNPGLRTQLGNAAQEFTLDNFGVQRLVHDHEELYKRLVSSPTKS